MSKPIVFISHINEEKELAIELKKIIEDNFLNMIDVFVSSDETSITVGTKWLDRITDALENCVIELILCSSQSVKRPWINFEAGAGWIRKIPVIPLCHSDMTPSMLPLPLNLLQAVSLSEITSLKHLVPILADSIGCKVPKIDFDEFITNVKIFEEKYIFWDQCNEAFAKINKTIPDLLTFFKNNPTKAYQKMLPEPDITDIQRIINGFLSNSNIIHFRRSGSSEFNQYGVYFGVIISIGIEFKNVVNNPNFHPSFS